MRLLLVSVAILTVACGGALLVGCGGGGGVTDNGGGGGGGGTGDTGLLRVALTDQGGYDSVVVAIKEIRVVPEGDEGQAEGGLPLIATFDPPLVVDIMELDYQQLLLGQNNVPDGTYTQLRLVLAPNVNGQEPVNYAVLAGTTDKIALDTPSGQQSGLKINGTFVVAPNTTSTVVVDFDPNRAIVTAGNSGKYILKPTGIRITQTLTVLPDYGALAGTVSPSDAWATALVEALPEGSTEVAASASVSAEDGSFRIPLAPGNYTLRVTATGYETLDTSLASPPVVYTVAEGADNAVGDLALTLLPTP